MILGRRALNTAALNTVGGRAQWNGLSAGFGFSRCAGQPKGRAYDCKARPGQSIALAPQFAARSGVQRMGAARVAVRGAIGLRQDAQSAVRPGIRIDFLEVVAWREGWRRAEAPLMQVRPGIRRDVWARVVWREGFRQAETALFVRRGGWPVNAGFVLARGEGLRLRLDLDIVWRTGRVPAFVADPWPAPIVPPKPPWEGSTALVFRDTALGRARLVFRRGRALRRIPMQEFYSVHNDAYVRRADDATPIECRAVTISGDMDSFGCRFTATVFPSEASKVSVDDGPVMIEVGANGTVFKALVRKVRDLRQFGQDALSIEGDSLSAELAAPIAAASSKTNAFEMTAQQIALGELDGTGWALDWQVVDWLMPAGAYSIAEATPMDGIKRLAEAVGGFVQADRADRILHVRKRYPVPPWRWAEATPDVILVPDAIESLGREWIEKPRYTGVYVSGQGHGVNAFCQRDGTDGSVLAPAVADALLTHQDANYARAEAILSDTGAQRLATLALGLYPSVGLIDQGLLVRVDEEASWFALSKGFSLSIEWGTGGLAIAQSVTLERHYE